jgi:hypothetical protein
MTRPRALALLPGFEPAAGAPPPVTPHRSVPAARAALRLVERNPSLRATLARLDLRRRRAQIAARHTLDRAVEAVD